MQRVGISHVKVLLIKVQLVFLTIPTDTFKIATTVKSFEIIFESATGIILLCYDHDFHINKSWLASWPLACGDVYL